MKISTRREGQATILDFSGNITLFNSPEVRKAVLTELRDHRATRLLLNLTGVRYIDSSGVASLVEGLKVSRDLNSQLALYGLSKSVTTVLELTHLLRVFEVHGTEQEALAGPPPDALSTPNGESA